jgi:hypothetical protein
MGSCRKNDAATAYCCSVDIRSGDMWRNVRETRAGNIRAGRQTYNLTNISLTSAKKKGEVHLGISRIWKRIADYLIANDVFAALIDLGYMQ